QIVLPPATTAGTVAITLRRQLDEVWSIGELVQRGTFRTTRRSSPTLDETERQLLKLLSSQQYEAFMRLAVASHGLHRTHNAGAVRPGFSIREYYHSPVVHSSERAVRPPDLCVTCRTKLCISK